MTDSTRLHHNRFFVWTALAMLAVLALAFGKSFYLRPVFSDKPLPAYLIVHGVVMTLWYLLFLAQASLANIGRRDLHRQLGIAGVLLALGVVATGAFVHLNFIGRMQAAGVITSPQDVMRGMGFVLAGLASLVPFVILIALAVGLRRKAALHKRLMFWALVWTLGPAFSNSRPLGQWLDPLVAPHLPFFPSDLFWLAALLAYDWKTLRRLHPATYLTFFLLAFYFFFVTDWLVGSALLQGWLQAYLQS
ncbi:MAG: hypothetical protein Q7J29_13345 [Stagnimonas sp.]|nr:hypothetical protein [Stagnimonas sp.]